MHLRADVDTDVDGVTELVLGTVVYQRLTSPARLISSTNGRFHAVYCTTGLTVDVYEQLADSQSATHLGTLTRDNYHTSSFFVVFVDVDDAQTRLVFNPEFEGLSVYELPSLAVLFRHVKKVEFLGCVVPISLAPDADQALANRFFWAWSWGWGPIAGASILDAYEVATQGTCECVFGCETREQTYALALFMTNTDNRYYKSSAPVVCEGFDPNERRVRVKVVESLTSPVYSSGDEDRDDEDEEEVV